MSSNEDLISTIAKQKEEVINFLTAYVAEYPKKLAPRFMLKLFQDKEAQDELVKMLAAGKALQITPHIQTLLLRVQDELDDNHNPAKDVKTRRLRPAKSRLLRSVLSATGAAALTGAAATYGVARGMPGSTFGNQPAITQDSVAPDVAIAFGIGAISWLLGIAICFRGARNIPLYDHALADHLRQAMPDDNTVEYLRTHMDAMEWPLVDEVRKAKQAATGAVR